MSARSEHDALPALSSLGPHALMVVWSVRQRLGGGPECPALVASFRRVFGLAAIEEALAAFEAFYLALSEHILEDFELMPPGCGRVSGDESRLAELCEAIRLGHPRRARALAAAAVGAGHAGRLCQTLEHFAALVPGRARGWPVHAMANPPGRTPTYH